MHSFSQFIAEGLTKVTCRRCGGSGKFSFNHRHGTMCYGCKGSGFQMVDLEKEKARDEKRMAGAAQDRDEQEKRAEAFNQKMEGLRKKYKGDKRLGSIILARMAEFPAVEQETLLALDQADSGGKIHPSVIERLGDSYLNVPFAQKDLAKSAGARWDAQARKWIWNVSKTLPDALKPFLE